MSDQTRQDGCSLTCSLGGHVMMKGRWPPELPLAPKSEPRAMTGRENTTCAGRRITVH
jgi:hypothetical protein